ncbi:MAG: AarF/UbiB family protein [Pseudomonadota bacterium]
MSDDNSLQHDGEANRFGKRLSRYAKVGSNVGSVAAKMAGERLGKSLFGAGNDYNPKYAAQLTSVLGNLKGPIMKVAQLLSTIPEAIPAEYAEELSKLQNQAPPMGWVFVKRRMAAELGANWQAKFAEFEKEAAASASLGQVHKAKSLQGEELACKLQYPDMQSAVEADLNQLGLLLSIYRRMDKAINTSEVLPEISARLREELNYELEACHTKLYRLIFENQPLINVPDVFEDLSSNRLLTLKWLQGKPLLQYKEHPLEDRNTIAKAMFLAWWFPFSHYGVIHGDPHLGNYTIFENDTGRPAGINLLDYGCIRTFKPNFVQGVVDLYTGLLNDDRAKIVHAYETWGFENLSNELIDILNIWANFIYGPLLEDRELTIADNIAPGEYGRKQAFEVHKGLREKGPVKIPREFIFMDRSAIGLGGVFIHLKAKMNFYQLFNETISDFDLNVVSQRQKNAFDACGVPVP